MKHTEIFWVIFKENNCLSYMRDTFSLQYTYKKIYIYIFCTGRSVHSFSRLKNNEIIKLHNGTEVIKYATSRNSAITSTTFPHCNICNTLELLMRRHTIRFVIIA
jgi:hypothetical protein